MRELFSYIFSPLAIFAFFAGGTLTTLTGPFGTYLMMGMIPRAIYWYTLIGVSIILALLIRRAIDMRFQERHFWFRSSLTTLIFTTLFTPCILALNYLLLGVAATEFMPIWKMYLVVLSVPVTVNPLIYFVLKLSGSEVDAPEPKIERAPERPRLFERLSDGLGQDLIRMSVQDHFVHVFLAEGSEKLRMRFADAMTEVDGVPGLRVHRSHWVAEDAVEGHAQEGAKVILKLSDGSTVPVSRNYRADVEAAGLLDLGGALKATRRSRPEQKSA